MIFRFKSPLGTSGQESRFAMRKRKPRLVSAMQKRKPEIGTGPGDDVPHAGLDEPHAGGAAPSVHHAQRGEP